MTQCGPVRINPVTFQELWRKRSTETVGMGTWRQADLPMLQPTATWARCRLTKFMKVASQLAAATDCMAA